MSIKIVLRKKITKDGTYPLALRITVERKASYVYLGYNVLEKDWDNTAQRVRKSHPNSARLNNLLIKKLSEANDKSLELNTAKNNVTAKTLRHKIKPSSKETVFKQGDLYLERLKEEGKYNRWNSEKSNVKHLKDFLGEDIAFQDLTIPLLKRFKASLISKRKVSERTAINNLVTVRSIFSMAIADGVCDQKYYPFGKGKITIKFPDSNKVGLTSEEVSRIENVDLDLVGNHARNLWLISFYFAGVRVSDVFRLAWSDFQDGRLYYSMGKNNKGDSLKVSDRVLAILDQYRDQRSEDSNLIFPELKGIDLTDRYRREVVTKSKINSTDRILRTVVAPAANIEKKLTMHIARHTFGNISGDKIPVQMLQKLYRHTDIKTTIGYQANFIHNDVDEALNSVIGI